MERLSGDYIVTFTAKLSENYLETKANKFDKVEEY